VKVLDKALKHDLQHTPKEVKVTLDKERTFRLDLNAYAELDFIYEDKGKTYHHIEADLLKMRPYAVRAFLWAGLVHEDRDLTIEFVSRYIDVHNIQEYSQMIYELILDDTPEVRSEKNGDSSDSDKKK
jgi:hypothetical protein